MFRFTHSSRRSISLLLVIPACMIALCRAQDPSVGPPVDPFPSSSPSPSSMPSSSPMPSPSPKGRVRPSIPKLFLSTAGRAPHVELPLRPFRRFWLCPKDYKNGFSIRCEVLNAGTVFWRVRGKEHKREYFAPYYISGNWRDRVGHFRALDSAPRQTRLRVTCRVPSRKPVWVDLIKSC